MLVDDVDERLRITGGAAGKSRAGRFRAAMAHLSEVYALEVLDEAVAGGAACRRLYREPELVKAFGK